MECHQSNGAMRGEDSGDLHAGKRALSSTGHDGGSVSWEMSEGDKLSKGKSVVVVESDRDVETCYGGYLATIMVEDGIIAPITPSALPSPSSSSPRLISLRPSPKPLATLHPTPPGPPPSPVAET